jgi:hypothetical protein
MWLMSVLWPRAARSPLAWASILGFLGLALIATARADAQTPEPLPAAQGLRGQLAWSRDGAYFISRSSYLLENKPHGLSMLLGVVRDSRSGIEQVFELGPSEPERALPSGSALPAEGSDAPEQRERLQDARRARPPLGGRAEFGRLQREHGAIPCTLALASPNQKISAQITVVGRRGSRLRTTWVGPTLEFADLRWQRSAELSHSGHGSSDYLPGRAVVTIRLLQAGQPPRAYATDLVDELGPLKGSLGLCWAPDNRRVALIVYEQGHDTRAYEAVGEFTRTLLLPLAGPRVLLRAPRAQLAALATQLTSALQQVGLAPVIELSSHEELQQEGGAAPPKLSSLRVTAAAQPSLRPIVEALVGKTAPAVLPPGGAYDLMIEVAAP